jgi:hypothetical protein
MFISDLTLVRSSRARYTAMIDSAVHSIYIDDELTYFPTSHSCHVVDCLTRKISCRTLTTVILWEETKGTEVRDERRNGIRVNQMLLAMMFSFTKQKMTSWFSEERG